MYKRLFENLRRLAWLLVLSLFFGAAMANDNLTKVVDGVTIYIGILPAEMIRGYPKEGPEGAMHGGVPRGGAVSRDGCVVRRQDGRAHQRCPSNGVRRRGRCEGMVRDAGANEHRQYDHLRQLLQYVGLWAFPDRSADSETQCHTRDRGTLRA